MVPLVPLVTKPKTNQKLTDKQKTREQGGTYAHGPTPARTATASAVDAPMVGERYQLRSRRAHGGSIGKTLGN